MHIPVQIYLKKLKLGGIVCPKNRTLLCKFKLDFLQIINNSI